MSLQFAFLTLIALFTLTTFHVPSVVGEQVLVRDCIGLQDALNNATVQKVLIEGHIKCSRMNWQVPVVVRRNVELTSSPEAGARGDVGLIDWADARHVVIAERGAIVHAHDLVMEQDEMGVGGLTLAFTHTREGATGVFTGLVVEVKMCPQPVGTYSSRVNGLPRPRFLTGEQRAKPVGDNLLWVQDVAIWWPNLNSLWQLCNSIFVCVGNYEGDIPIQTYFESGLVSSTCASITDTDTSIQGLTTFMEDFVPNEGEESNSRSQSSNTQSTIVVIIIVIGGVILIAAILAYYTFGPQLMCSNKTMAGSLNRDRSSIGETSSRNGDNLSSRYISHGGNELNMNIFSEGGNVPLKDVEIGPMLGRGSFGKVYKGTWKGSPVAIKLIEHGETLLNNSLKLPFEAYLSRNVSHPNVVQTFLVYTQPKDSPRGIAEHTLDVHIETPSSDNGGAGGGGKEHSTSLQDVFSNMGHNTSANAEAGELFVTWLVLEYCDKGSLAKAVKKGLLNQSNSTEPLLDHVLLSSLDVANAMNYLHSMDITHGDLKADNVLLKRATSDRRGFFCKVSDFGLSKFVGKDDYVQTFTYGTITHMPPELLKDGALSTAVDVYSFGMFLWELLAKAPPYPGQNHGDIMMTVVSEGRRPQITDDYPQMYADLIRDCWKQKPDDRPSFMEIVKRLKNMLTVFEIGNTRLQQDGSFHASNASAAGASLKRFKGSGNSDRRQFHPSLQSKNYFSTMPHSSALTPLNDSQKTGSLTASLPVDMVFESRTSSFHLSSDERSSASFDDMPEWEEYHHHSPHTSQKSDQSLTPSSSSSSSSCQDSDSSPS